MGEAIQHELELGGEWEHESKKAVGKPPGRIGKGVHATLVLLLLIAAFYLSGITTVVSLKKLMRTHPFPFLWCTVQFVFAYMISQSYVWITDPTAAVMPAASGLASLCNALGFIVTNVALKYGKHTQITYRAPHIL
jgi:hypothetical protein